MSWFLVHAQSDGRFARRLCDGKNLESNRRKSSGGYPKIQCFEGSQVRDIETEQLSTFSNVVDTKFIPFFTINAFTGLRRAEAKRLDCSEIKIDRRLIDLPSGKSKNKRRKLVEIPDNLTAWLTPQAKTEGSIMPRAKDPGCHGECRWESGNWVAAQLLAPFLLQWCWSAARLHLDESASGPLGKSVEGSPSGSGYEIRSRRLLRHPRIRPAPINSRNIVLIYGDLFDKAVNGYRFRGKKKPAD
jgi:hypothetical protein